MMKTAIAPLALCLSLGACNQPAASGNNAAAPVDTAAAVDAIKAVETSMQAAFKSKDAKALIGAYASDAEIMNPFEPVHAPTDAAKVMDDPAFTLSFVNTKAEVSASGDMGFTRGTYSVTYTDPQTKKPAKGSGNYVTVFKKQADGSWKAIEDIATPGPAAS